MLNASLHLSRNFPPGCLPADPVKLPGAGDVFTAYELASSLIATYFPAIKEVRNEWVAESHVHLSRAFFC